MLTVPAKAFGALADERRLAGTVAFVDERGEPRGLARFRTFTWTRSTAAASRFWVGHALVLGYGVNKGMDNASSWIRQAQSASLFGGSSAHRDWFFTLVWLRFLLPWHVLRLGGLVALVWMMAALTWTWWVELLVIVPVLGLWLLFSRPWNFSCAQVVYSLEDAKRVSGFIARFGSTLPAAALLDSRVQSQLAAALPASSQEVALALCENFPGTASQLLAVVCQDLGLPSR